MVPVATHPPLASALVERDSFLPTSGSRVDVVSDDDHTALSAQSGNQAAKPRGDSEENTLTRRQQDVSSSPNLDESQENGGDLTGFQGIRELTTFNAAPEACQALEAPASQADCRAQAAKSNDATPPAVSSTVTGNGEIEAELLPARNLNQQSIAAKEVIGIDAASPTSSSADAPGSDYEGLDDREQDTHLRIPLEAQEDRSTLATSAAPCDDGDLGEAQIAGQEGEDSSGSNPAKISAPSYPEDPQGSETTRPASPKSKASEDRVAIEGTGANVPDFTVAVEIIPEVATSVFATMGTDPGAVDPNTRRPQQDAHLATQQQDPLVTLTRTSEIAGEGPSFKRQKLEDTHSISVEAKSPQPRHFATPQAKRSTKEGVEPLGQPKTPSRPRAASNPKIAPNRKAARKEKIPTEAQGKKHEGQAENADSVTAPDSDRVPTIGQAPKSLLDDSVSVKKAPAPKPKKARAPPQKRFTKAANVPEDKPCPPPVQLPASNFALPIPRTSLYPSDTTGSAAEGPAPTEKAKGNTRAKPASKSKSKAKVEPLSSPSKGTVRAERASNVGSKPASKPGTAKKAKRPMGKQHSGEAVEVGSELAIDVRSCGPDEELMREGEVLATSSHWGSIHAGQGSRPSLQGDERDQPSSLASRAPIPGDASVSYASSNIFTSAPPQMYPAQAYYPTRMQGPPQQGRGLSTLTSAAFMLESEMQSCGSTVARHCPSSSDYEGMNVATSPTTAVNTTGSVMGDAASDATSLSPDQSIKRVELDPRMYPRGWRPPELDLMDPDLLMTTLRERTVWTFWDCYLPLGCRDQDMVMLSNDGIAFPCAAWNPCLFSTLLKQVIRDPSRPVRLIMKRGPDENRKLLGYIPLPCVKIDENWHATNLLLSFLHPIPTMFLPDRTTCRLVLDIGLRYGVDRAISAATQRLNQLDEEDRAAKSRGKGKAKSTEEEIAVDLAERVASEFTKFD